MKYEDIMSKSRPNIEDGGREHKTGERIKIKSQTSLNRGARNNRVW